MHHEILSFCKWIFSVKVLTKSVTKVASATITKTETVVTTTPTAARERKTKTIPGCPWLDQ